MITLKEDAKKLNCDGLSYTVWMRRVNTWLIAQCGLSSDDLADGPSWDMWNSGVTPAEYGQELLDENGFPGEE